MPQASVNVQVLTIVYAFGQDPGVKSSTGLTVISPSQLSIAVKSTAAGASASHCATTSAGAAGATGASVSPISNV